MNVKASSSSSIVKPQSYRTTSLSTIIRAEQQDRFLDLGELNQLVTFLNSGKKRLEIADILTQNANFLVARAADKIFTGGSAISYLEKPQTSIIMSKSDKRKRSNTTSRSKKFNVLLGDSDAIPTGFKPIDVTKYGTIRMKKSLRDLDWFLRYLTYAIVAGDSNILSVNIRGLRELIDNACSSSVTIVALKTMRKAALRIFNYSTDSQALVSEYFNLIVREFESAAYTDKFKKRSTNYLQGLRLPQTYVQASNLNPRFAMKNSLSESEKVSVIKACYRQVFERDISKAYSLSLTNLESKVKNGKLSVKEFIRSLGLSKLYCKQFFEPFVNSRALELAFRHFLGRGPSSLQEFQKYFAILSEQGLPGIVNSLISSDEYTNYFGEETVPYFRKLGEEAQECNNWGPQLSLLNYSAPFVKVPQFITLFSDYNQPLPDQHPYGRSNDPLNLQFGAVFLKSQYYIYNQSAPFSKNTRRILIRKGPAIYNQLSRPSSRSEYIGSLVPIIFQCNTSNNSTNSSKLPSYSMSSILNAIYLRVFGRLVYVEEKLSLKSLENLFLNSQISVREFVRQLTKSFLFRSLYWQPLYICKAIEYIHSRIIGRPTYGRQEINKYFDIAYKQGYYKIIDSMIDSLEYIESFGDNKVPYDRYTTSNNIVITRSFTNQYNNMLEQFIDLGKTVNVSSFGSIQEKILQGVSKRRYQLVIFTAGQQSSSSYLQKIFRVCYRQIFEKDISIFNSRNELLKIRRDFTNKKITVKQLVLALGRNDLYKKEFYQPYPNTKVIELGMKHFLGRAPSNQLEIRYYNQILASEGLIKFVESIVNNTEYYAVFGDNIVPYRRFPTLPATSFSKTQKLYTNLQSTL
uniref:Phycobiliprotein ApcE n=1 Tax=Apophlaea sinclairii TaxID=212746 RepID=A0A1C9CBG6_9FLOR|nr:phycobilisome core-membrane linker protein [Apophlaea sinclairii]AOM65717.1 phycobilisome core-membrane linker protein [Apophlaea sinclairii]